MLIAPEEPECVTIAVPVLRVFDGDGFLTRIQKPGYEPREASVRFGFVDAPEMDQPGGRGARNFLESLIGGKWLELSILIKADTGGFLDRHGRIVAVPYLRREAAHGEPDCISKVQRFFSFANLSAASARNIELEMVLNGWAWVLDRYGPDDRYFAALEDAQRHRRGIWARDDNVHPWDFKKQRYARRKNMTSTQLGFLDCAELEAPCGQDGCEGHLVKRKGKFGNFYGCSTYPNCRISRSPRA